MIYLVKHYIDVIHLVLTSIMMFNKLMKIHVNKVVLLTNHIMIKLICYVEINVQIMINIDLKINIYVCMNVQIIIIKKHKYGVLINLVVKII